MSPYVNIDSPQRFKHESWVKTKWFELKVAVQYEGEKNTRRGVELC